MNTNDTTQKVYDYLCARQKQGAAVSLQEIADDLGLTDPSHSLYHVRKLIRAGKVTRLKNQHRGIRVIRLEA
jgi:DNA-binding MarR family transcriptional regulator